ncbi:hypothetical protein [Methanobrevibacter sp.]|uniref:hypothetical protein n=1 Tax=Methanobrevibacter sp. TaxID=66852 RepID=UPI00388F6347
MSEEKITYADVEEYQSLFTLAPSFLLETFARRNTNLVLKFKSIIGSYMDSLTDIQKEKLYIILSTDIDELQGLMNEAYQRTQIKQYEVLSNPNYKQFINDNLDEIRSLLKYK